MMSRDHARVCRLQSNSNFTVFVGSMNGVIQQVDENLPNLIGVRPKGARVLVRFEIHPNPLFFSISVNQLKRFVYQCLHVDFRQNLFIFTNIGKELMGNRSGPFNTGLDFFKGLVERRPVGYLGPTPFFATRFSGNRPTH
jgi:hypothetical protein